MLNPRCLLGWSEPYKQLQQVPMVIYLIQWYEILEKKAQGRNSLMELGHNWSHILPLTDIEYALLQKSRTRKLWQLSRFIEEKVPPLKGLPQRVKITIIDMVYERQRICVIQISPQVSNLISLGSFSFSFSFFEKN